MSLGESMLAGVPSLRVPTVFVIFTSILSTLVVTVTATFLIITDKLSYYFVLSPLRILTFGTCLYEISWLRSSGLVQTVLALWEGC